MRAGRTSRACALLVSAAVGAMKIQAYKEAVNMLSEALAADTSKVNKAYYLGLMGWIRCQRSNFDSGGNMAIEGLKLIAEETGNTKILPHKVSKVMFDQALREWKEVGEYCNVVYHDWIQSS
jgi:hypothetical protein